MLKHHVDQATATGAGGGLALCTVEPTCRCHAGISVPATVSGVGLFFLLFLLEFCSFPFLSLVWDRIFVICPPLSKRD